MVYNKLKGAACCRFYRIYSRLQYTTSYTTAVEKWTIVLDKNKGCSASCLSFSEHSSRRASAVCSCMHFLWLIPFVSVSFPFRRNWLLHVSSSRLPQRSLPAIPGPAIYSSWFCTLTKPEKININTSCWTRPVSKLYKVVKFPSTLCSYSTSSSLASPPLI